VRRYGLKVNPSPESDSLKEKQDSEEKVKWQPLTLGEIFKECGVGEFDIRSVKTTGSPEE